jgi:hypothetical protein
MERIHAWTKQQVSLDRPIQLKKEKKNFFNFLFKDLFKPCVCLLLEKVNKSSVAPNRHWLFFIEMLKF